MSDQLFFALWPDPVLLQALRAHVDTIVASVKGKPQVVCLVASRVPAGLAAPDEEGYTRDRSPRT